MENDLTRWLASVVALFDSTLNKIMGIAVLRLLLVTLVFVVMVECFAWLGSKGRRERK